jgi:3-oxoadipate enol-lactonase
MKAAIHPIWISTTIGRIAVFQKQGNAENTPIIFLHGVYFDHLMWIEIMNKIADTTVIALDMPLHGASKERIKSDWTLDDCAEMLLEILDNLKINKIIAVGHSWGSMTILRAANKQPELFEGILLCNMPFKGASKKQKLLFRLQHLMLGCRNFYTVRVAKALFGKTSLSENPQLIQQLRRTMSVLTNKEIRMVDNKVILEAADTSELILSLKVNALAMKGIEDYVPIPPGIETIIVKGGHVSPLEKPEFILDSLIHVLPKTISRLNY